MKVGDDELYSVTNSPCINTVLLPKYFYCITDTKVHVHVGLHMYTSLEQEIGTGVLARFYGLHKAGVISSSLMPLLFGSTDC